jgi:hypothetical protein
MSGGDARMSAHGGLLVVFLDGVGIGPGDPAVNPFLRADLPVHRRLLGRVPTLDDPVIDGRDAQAGESGEGGADAHRPVRLVPLDARLGVEGLPQSGTGQTALFTGTNAAREFGRHFGPWVPVGLRPLLEREGVLRRAGAAGHRVAFANAYPAGWMESRGHRRPAAPPLLAHAAGVLNRTPDDLLAGEAVASEITHEGWRRYLGPHLPRIRPREAGRRLGRIAASFDLTLFAHYSTDTAGHRGGMEGAVVALERVDAFLGGVLATLPAHTSLWVVSDHGNVEDVRGGHTLNPAMGLLLGPVRPRGTGRVDWPRIDSLLDVTPAILSLLG